MAARLGKKLRKLGFQSFAEYHRHVLADCDRRSADRADRRAHHQPHQLSCASGRISNFWRGRRTKSFARFRRCGSGARPVRAARSRIRSPCVWRSALARTPAAADSASWPPTFPPGCWTRPARRLPGGTIRRCPGALAARLPAAGRGRIQGILQGEAGDWRSASNSSGST